MKTEELIDLKIKWYLQISIINKQALTEFKHIRTKLITSHCDMSILRLKVNNVSINFMYDEWKLRVMAFKSHSDQPLTDFSCSLDEFHEAYNRVINHKNVYPLIKNKIINI